MDSESDDAHQHAVRTTALYCWRYLLLHLPLPVDLDAQRSGSQRSTRTSKAIRSFEPALYLATALNRPGCYMQHNIDLKLAPEKESRCFGTVPPRDRQTVQRCGMLTTNAGVVNGCFLL